MANPNRESLARIIRQRSIEAAQRDRITGEVYRHFLANAENVHHPNFASISSADLGLLFQLTDELFFEGLAGRLCEEVSARPLKFRLSTRMTTSGGTTTMFSSGQGKRKQLEFEIAIATTPLFATFPRTGNSDQNQASRVGGIVCRNRVEALQRIMEHEMVHLIEMLLWNDSNCSAGPFKRIVRNFFGHTASNHQLLTPTDIARNRLGIRPGDKVTFEHQGQALTGMVNRITKRATVLVRDPSGRPYTDGQHYATYYVPLQRLRKAG